MFVDPYDESLLDIVVVVVDVIVASVVDGGGTVDDEDEDEDNNDDGGIVVVVIRLLNWLLSVWFVFIIRFILIILFFIDNIVGRIGLRLPSSFETLNSNDECVNNGSW